MVDLRIESRTCYRSLEEGLGWGFHDGVDAYGVLMDAPTLDLSSAAVH